MNIQISRNYISLSIWLYPINVKTAEPIGPIFYIIILQMTPDKVYRPSICTNLFWKTSTFLIF